MPRRGAKPYDVHLTQYQKAEYSRTMDQSFAPDERYSRAPNLRRVAIVSAPTTLEDGKTSANDVINAKLDECLAKAKKRAAEKGWKPKRPWRSSEEANKEWREYFDQKPMTLASQNITPTG